MFAALARAAELRLSDFNVQALANTAWAFAMVAQSDAELFRALARAATKRLKAQKLKDAKVDSQILAMLTWSAPQLQMLSKCLTKTI